MRTPLTIRVCNVSLFGKSGLCIYNKVKSHEMLLPCPQDIIAAMEVKMVMIYLMFSYETIVNLFSFSMSFNLSFQIEYLYPYFRSET